MAKTLKIENLSVSYGAINALQNINIEIEEGTIATRLTPSPQWTA